MKTNNIKPVFVSQVSFLIFLLLQLLPLFVLAQDIPKPTGWACASCGATAPVYTPIQHKPSCEYNSGTSNSGTGNSGPNWAQILANKKAAAEARKRAESYQLNEKGVKAYNERKWEEAVRYFKAAVKKNGSDPVMRQNLVNAQNNLNAQKKADELALQEKIKKQEQLRQEQLRQQELQRQEQERKQKLEAEKTQFNRLLTAVPPPVMPSGTKQQETLPAGPRVGGLTLAEWNEARMYQYRIDSITRNWPLSAAEATLLEQWEEQRNRLWKKAISVPGLTYEERQRLRLQLYVPAVYQNSIPQARTSPETLQQWFLNDNQQPISLNYSKLKETPSNPAIVHMITDFSAETIESQLEEKITDYLEEQRKGAGKHLGYLFKTARLTIAYKDDGAAGVISEGAETFLVGSIPIPQAQLAVTGGRMYSNVAYHTLNQFMIKAMNSVNATFDADQFWNNLKAESGTGVKAVMNFIQWPPNEKEK